MKDKYYELTLTLKDDFVEFIADYIANIIGDGVEIGRGKIIVRSEESVDFIKNTVDSLIVSLGTPLDIEYKIEQKDNEDWIQKYKSSIKPIEVGKFYIYPSWYPPKDSKINIKIDPALAFGSGHHATTYSCLEAISELLKGNERVLDVGCGSGILGLACCKLGCSIELCDTDPISVDSCDKNFKLNKVDYGELWEGSANRASGEYDIVIANIIADVLKFIVNDIKKVLKKDSILILSGILDKKESQVTKVYSDLKLLDRKQKDEWVTLIYTNR
ncbi:MAG: 50S ribosomal protein L11 methyltransferase [Sulfurovaceae bacterium]|nr:50S ribosomal protein L11 methyltransferase [Sulfurovaceae bacterium]